MMRRTRERPTVQVDGVAADPFFEARTRFWTDGVTARMALMTTPDRTPEGWGDVAEAYDEHIAPLMVQFARAALDATELRKGDAVLDVAAGSGALAREAARRGASVLATDFSPGMVRRLQQRAREESLHLEARVMDGQALEVADGSFTTAYCNMGLMFFPAPAKGLSEMRRVLVAGGRAGIVTWTAPERSQTFATMFAALHDAVPDLPPAPEPPAVFSLADPDDLARRMEGAGFRDVAVRQITAAFTAPSPEAAWAAMIESNPVMPAMLSQVGPANADAVRQAYIRRAAAFVRDGEVRMMGEANLATGTT